MEPAAFRELLEDASRQLGPRTGRVMVKRAAPLRSQGDEVGALEVLLRCGWHGDGRVDGVLTFRWHDAAAGHSVVRALEAWRTGTTTEALDVESKPVPMTVDGRAGRQMKVTFAGSEVPAQLDPLLGTAARLGCLEAARAEMRDVLTREPMSEPIARSAPQPKAPPARPQPVETRAAPPSAPPPRERTAEERQRADTVEHNAPFDAQRHPHVGVNEEITNSDGATFRLVVKRRGGQQKRMWTRVASIAVERSHH